MIVGREGIVGKLEVVGGREEKLFDDGSETSTCLIA